MPLAVPLIVVPRATTHSLVAGDASLPHLTLGAFDAKKSYRIVVLRKWIVEERGQLTTQRKAAQRKDLLRRSRVHRREGVERDPLLVEGRLGGHRTRRVMTPFQSPATWTERIRCVPHMAFTARNKVSSRESLSWDSP
jgi:hypothetical protein